MKITKVEFNHIKQIAKQLIVTIITINIQYKPDLNLKN